MLPVVGYKCPSWGGEVGGRNGPARRVASSRQLVSTAHGRRGRSIDEGDDSNLSIIYKFHNSYNTLRSVDYHST